MSAPHIPLIVEMHAEDAAFLWLQRDAAVEAPHFNRKFLARLDERLEAHLDGLRVAGRHGWEIARAAYDKNPEPGEVFTLATLAFGAGSARGISEVLDIVEADEDGVATRAAISGLGWLEPVQLQGHVQPLLDDKRIRVRALGLGACAVHRVDPGPQLMHFLSDAPPVRWRALKLTGLLGRVDLKPDLGDEDDDECRFRATWAAVRLGDREKALAALWHIAGKPGPFQIRAFELAVIATRPDEAGTRLRDTGVIAEPLAVRAAGRLGQSDMIPWLIQQMHNGPLARVAAESFAMITGADLAFLDLDSEAPGDEGPNDEPADPLVELDPDMDLPVPNPVAVQAWWTERQNQYQAGQQYFLGHPVSAQVYAAAFEGAFQRQRRVAALALGCLQPARPLLNWRARQTRLIGPHHAPGYWQTE